MGREKQTPRSKPSSQRRSAQANESKGQASEKIFNLFLFVDGELITKLGGVCHEKSGSDRDKLSFLQANVNDDLPNAIDFSVPGRYQLATSSGLKPGLRYEGYMRLAELGKRLEVFEEIFAHFNGPPDPLSCITPIVDGKPKIEAVTRF